MARRLIRRRERLQCIPVRALDPGLALAEARRVAKPTARIAICKWGPPNQNEFFAFLASLHARDVPTPATDSVEIAIREAALHILMREDVPAPIEMADDAALQAALTEAGILIRAQAHAEEVAFTPRLAAAAAPFRRPDGGYRFGNFLRCWIARP